MHGPYCILCYMSCITNFKTGLTTFFKHPVYEDTAYVIFKDMIIHLFMQFQLVTSFAIVQVKSFNVKMGNVCLRVWFVMETMTVGITPMKNKIVVSKSDVFCEGYKS